MSCHCNSLVYSHLYIGTEELALSQHPDGCAVTIQQGSVLCHLLQLHLGHGHEGIDFMLGALEVLYAECVDGDDLDASLVADLEDLRWSARLKNTDDSLSYPR